jgi:hypothetical protein
MRGATGADRGGDVLALWPTTGAVNSHCPAEELRNRLLLRRDGLSRLARASAGSFAVAELYAAAGGAELCRVLGDALADDATTAKLAGRCGCSRHVAEESDLRTWVVLERMLRAARDALGGGPQRMAATVAMGFVDGALVVLDELDEHLDALDAWGDMVREQERSGR